MNKIITLLMPILLVSNCMGQNYNPIKIGFKVPNIAFQTINDTSAKLKLSDFKGKLVILDFWATWCTSCIKHFPEMDSIQKIYKKNLQVILVHSIKGSGDNFIKLENFYKNYISNYKGTFSPLIAIKDTVAYNLFPHTFLPHYVWIDKEGRLIAITSPGLITKKIIEELIVSDTL